MNAQELKGIPTKVTLNRFLNGWYAQILGPDARYKLARRFLGKRRQASACYYTIDATEDLAKLPIGAVVEVCIPSHRHSYRDYYVKISQTEFQEVAIRLEPGEEDKILSFLKNKNKNNNKVGGEKSENR